MSENKTWIADIDEDGVVTIPDELMEKLGWKVGDILDYDIKENGEIYITKVEPESIHPTEEANEPQDDE